MSCGIVLEDTSARKSQRGKILPLPLVHQSPCPRPPPVRVRPVTGTSVPRRACYGKLVCCAFDSPRIALYCQEGPSGGIWRVYIFVGECLNGERRYNAGRSASSGEPPAECCPYTRRAAASSTTGRAVAGQACYEFKSSPHRAEPQQ